MNYKKPEQYKKEQELAILMNDGVVVEMKASIFFRSNKRKPKEEFKNYRRGLRNEKKALKAYSRRGVNATVLLNKETMTIV